MIQQGDTFPSLTLKTMSSEGPTEVTTDQLTQGKKVVLFAVPGAFTPGCSKTHLPGYVEQAAAIKAKGVDTIVCTSVNDVFVMGAWGEAHQADDIVMLADGNGALAEALGLSMDASGWDMGTRSQRYAMIIENGVVSYLAVEPKGGIVVSAAEAILEQL